MKVIYSTASNIQEILEASDWQSEPEKTMSMLLTTSSPSILGSSSSQSNNNQLMIDTNDQITVHEIVPTSSVDGESIYLEIETTSISSHQHFRNQQDDSQVDNNLYYQTIIDIKEQYGQVVPQQKSMLPLNPSSSPSQYQMLLQRHQHLLLDENRNRCMDDATLALFQPCPISIESLPVEILFFICKYLDVECLKSLYKVNKTFKNLIDDDDIWKHVFLERYGKNFNSNLPKDLSWKQFYSTHKIYNGTWDKVRKGRITISQDGRTVTHAGDYLGSYQSSRGTERIDSGCVYWEISIENLNFNQTGFHLVVGVIPESFTVWQSYLTSNGGWGYLADGRKANNSGNGIQFAKGFVQGDRIGVLVDMNQQTLSYYLNGIFQGVAFRNLDQPVYPGVSLLTGGQSISFVKDPVFPKIYQ